MSNLIESGINRQDEGLTRREALPRIAGLVATALVLAGGCAEIDLPQTTGREGNDRPQTVPEPQIDEEAARNVSVLYMVALGAGLFFLRNIR